MRNKLLTPDRIYLWILLTLCAIIPHAVLILLGMDFISASFSPAEVEIYANFFVCQWLPFWLVFIAYLRLQKQDSFSPLPAICAGMILLSYLPRFHSPSVLALMLTVPLILLMELSAFLKTAEASANPFLRAIAADRGILRAFSFWSVLFPCMALLSCRACTFPRTVVSPFLMLPIPGVLLFDVFRHQKAQPPTLWAVLTMLAMIPLSLYLVTIGPMAQFTLYHLMSLITGFVFVFLMLIVYNMDQWKK